MAEVLCSLGGRRSNVMLTPQHQYQGDLLPWSPFLAMEEAMKTEECNIAFKTFAVSLGLHVCVIFTLLFHLFKSHFKKK